MAAAAAELSHRIPLEIIEEILLYLPVKTLIRFSTVSRCWNSKIFEPDFIRKHKDRAALLRRHRIIINAHDMSMTKQMSCFCDISSISPTGTEIKLRCSGDTFLPENPTLVAADTVGRFHGDTRLLTFCDELWCVEVDRSLLFLWNPSIRNYRRIPNPLFLCRRLSWLGGFIYGLGYDSVSDDYKILKIPHDDDSDIDPSQETEVYSLKSNSWRMIESPPSIPTWKQSRCELLHENLHWINCPIESSPAMIVSFNLLTEKYEAAKASAFLGWRWRE